MKNSERGRLGLPPDRNQSMVEYYNGKRLTELVEDRNNGDSGGLILLILAISTAISLLPLAIMSIVPGCIVYYVNKKGGRPSFMRTYLGSFFSILVFNIIGSITILICLYYTLKIEGEQISEFILPLILLFLGFLGAVFLSAMALRFITRINYIRAFLLFVFIVIPVNLLFYILSSFVSIYYYLEQNNIPIPTIDEMQRLIQEFV